MSDRIHFQELSEQNPTEVCRRAVCQYDEEARFYTLSVWGDKYRIYPHQNRINCMNEYTERLHEYFYLFIIHYLLNSKEIDIVDEWISEKDIPGGTTFFRGPHEIPVNLIKDRFDNDIIQFKKRCEQLHGRQLAMADTAYLFEITPRIPVAVLYWQGDDEFPAESKILYDRTIMEHLASDVIFALAIGICKRLEREPNTGMKGAGI